MTEISRYGNVNLALPLGKTLGVSSKGEGLTLITSSYVDGSNISSVTISNSYQFFGPFDHDVKFSIDAGSSNVNYSLNGSVSFGGLTVTSSDSSISNGSEKYKIPPSQGQNTVISVVYPLFSTGGQKTVTPSPNTAGAIPTLFALSPADYAVLPASVGDIIEIISALTIGTPAGSGAIISIWSIGGSIPRDWTSGVIGLQSVSGALTIPASNDQSAQLRAVALNSVISSDVDNNGNVCFAIYIANSVTGAYTHTSNYNTASIPLGVTVAKNLKQNQPGITNLPNKFTLYPGSKIKGKVDATPLNINVRPPQTSFGVNSALSVFDPSGSFDIILTPNVGDIIELDTQLTSDSNQYGFCWYSIAGNQVRHWNMSGVVGALNQTLSSAQIFESNSGPDTAIDIKFANVNQAYLSKSVNRVVASDLNSSGQLILKGYITSGLPSPASSINIIGMYNGLYQNLSYVTVTQWAAERSFVVGVGALPSAGQIPYPAEPCPWVDVNGVVNILHDTGVNGLVWMTAPTPNGPWTTQATNLFSSYFPAHVGVYYEGGLVYIYFQNPAAATGVVAVGATPSTAIVQTIPALANSEIAPLTATGHNSVFNFSVCKGPAGVYYMGYELIIGASIASGNYQTNPSAGVYTNGQYPNWQIAFATSLSPLGPFKYIPKSCPQASLQGAAYSTVGGTWHEWTGDEFRMVYHSAVVANANVPLYNFCATSPDCINWTPIAVNTRGELTPINGPSLMLQNASAGDVAYIRWNGENYLFGSDYQQNSTTQYGGFYVTNPTIYPVKLGDSTPYSFESSNVVKGVSPTVVAIASLSTYTNTSKGQQQLVVNGTVTAQTITRNGIVVVIPIAVLMVELSPGDIYTPTYSVAPTFTVIQSC